jgi:Ni2+-binding GTPase involved in maturation of urease and hydrogenase
VLEKVRKAPLYVFENPIRLDEMVEDLENTVLLQRQRGKPQVVGIVGSSGDGKTTLAKELINRKSSSFNRTCFLFDVSKKASKSLHLLQRKLFKDLTNMNIQIESVAQGIELFTKDISSIGATAFVILDDIDEVHQLEALLPVQNVLPSKSLILITSRSKDVLTSSGVEESSIYNLTDYRQSSSLAKYPSFFDGR